MNWLAWLWKLKVPRSAGSLSKLETQESQPRRVPSQWLAGLRPGKVHVSEEFKKGKSQCSSSKAVRQERVSLAWGRGSFFVLVRPSTDWMRFTHGMEGNLRSLPTETLMSSENTLRNSQNNAGSHIRAYCGSVKLTQNWPSQWVKKRKFWIFLSYCLPALAPCLCKGLCFSAATVPLK